MRWLGLSFALTLSACADQQTLDTRRFAAVAASCGVSTTSFKPVATDNDRRDESHFSPFRQFGRLWRERRSRERGVVRRYVFDVPARTGGVGQYGGEQTPIDALRRSQIDRQLSCLDKGLAPFGISVRPKSPVLVDQDPGMHGSRPGRSASLALRPPGGEHVAECRGEDIQS